MSLDYEGYAFGAGWGGRVGGLPQLSVAPQGSSGGSHTRVLPIGYGPRVSGPGARRPPDGAALESHICSTRAGRLRRCRCQIRMSVLGG